MGFIPPLPIILILGPTASGKSALALALARRFHAEIVSADAMAVYRGLDIGTAKPTPAELDAVPHHLVSFLDPSERCDVARWLTLADEALVELRARRTLAIVAGGSPLYAKVLLEGLSAGAPRDEAVRAEFNARYDAEGGAALHQELERADPAYAAARHANDRQRIVRALEVHRLTGRPYSSFHTTAGVRRADLRPLLIGLEWKRAALYERINARAQEMFARGLIDEVRALAPRLSAAARQAVGYKEVLTVLEGRINERQALELVQRNSRHLAKHQLTWYRGWSDIRWLPGDAPDLSERAEVLVREFLGAEWLS